MLILLTLDVDHETGGEAGTNTVDRGAEELPGVVGAHADPGAGAVHTRLSHLDPGHPGHWSWVSDQTINIQDSALFPPVLQRSNIRLQDDSG